MSSVQIIFAPSAERELKKLTRVRQTEVILLLRKMRDGSDTLSIEKNKGHPSFFRIKGKDMRVIYHPLTGTRIVILVIQDRKEAYRGLNDLNSKLEAALHRIEEEATLSLRARR